LDFEPNSILILLYKLEARGKNKGKKVKTLNINKRKGGPPPAGEEIFISISIVLSFLEIITFVFC